MTPDEHTRLKHLLEVVYESDDPDAYERYSEALDAVWKAERIDAWHQIARHPFFEPCYDEERPLIDAMRAALDRAAESDTPTPELTLRAMGLDWEQRVEVYRMATQLAGFGVTEDQSMVFGLAVSRGRLTAEDIHRLARTGLDVTVPTLPAGFVSVDPEKFVSPQTLRRFATRARGEGWRVTAEQLLTLADALDQEQGQ